MCRDTYNALPLYAVLMWVLSAEMTAQAVNIAGPITGTNETASKETMFPQASMHEVKVAHETKCSNVTPIKEAMFDQASMLLCHCLVRTSARDLQLDSEVLRLFIRFLQVSLLGSCCMHHKHKHDVADLEYTYIQTITMEEVHAQLHCYCRPNLESRPGSTGVSFPCQVRKYTATATQSESRPGGSAEMHAELL